MMSRNIQFEVLQEIIKQLTKRINDLDESIRTFQHENQFNYKQTVEMGNLIKQMKKLLEEGKKEESEKG